MWTGKSEKGNNTTFIKSLTMTLSKYRLGIVAFVVVTILFLSMYLPRGGSEFEDTQQLDISNALARPRLLQYCNKNISEGMEGRKFNGHEVYDLKYVVLTVRHGDRSAIHKIPGSADVKRVPGSNSLLSPEAIDHRPKMEKFVVNMKQDTIVEKKNDDTEDTNAALDTTLAFHTPDLELHQGQLTSIGFMQHITLGKALHHAYNELVDKVKSKDQLYVRSTKYTRTIQSVTGLMISLLPNLGSTSDKTDVLVYDNEEDEIMHGIGVRTSSRRVNHTSATGESVHFGGCAGSVSLAKKQAKAFVPSTTITNSMIAMFGSDVTKLKTEEMADAAVPRFCHRQSLPCVAEVSITGRSLASTSCMQLDLVERMMRQSDRLYCEKYTGNHGGGNATKLALYPFMKEILTHLSQPTKADSSNRLLSLFSGHDTVIAPVLAALGVYRGDLCQWPPYASRIAFELWAPKAPKDNDGLSYRVRVIYNGLDVTKMIPTCLAEQERNPTAGALCSLSALQQQVDNMITPYDSIESACSAYDVK